MYRYTLETVKFCVGVLCAHSSFADALAAIQLAHPSLNGDNLCKAFKRHGFNAPRTYLGLTLAPVASAPGPSAFVYPSRSGQQTYTSKQVPVNLPERGQTTRILVLPDMHFPFEDRLVWSTMLAVARDMRPDVVVIIGDWIDCFSISEFPKTPGRAQCLKDEVDAGGAALDELLALRVPRVVWTEGNHEERLTRTVIAKNPALWGFVPTIPDYLQLKEKGVEWVPYRRWIKIGKFAFTHEVGYCGVNAARASLMAFGNNIVFGHSHRAGVVYSGNTEGDKHVALNVGWGGDFDQVDYGHRAQQVREWQHAFGWVVQDERGCGWGTVTPIIDGRCVVDGRVISGRSKEAA